MNSEGKQKDGTRGEKKEMLETWNTKTEIKYTFVGLWTGPTEGKYQWG